MVVSLWPPFCCSPQTTTRPPELLLALPLLPCSLLESSLTRVQSEMAERLLHSSQPPRRTPPERILPGCDKTSRCRELKLERNQQRRMELQPAANESSRNSVAVNMATTNNASAPLT